MNALQTKKLCKYRAVQALLRTTTETSGIALLPAKLTALSAKLAEIDELALRQSQPSRGYTAERNELFADMIDAALDVSSLTRCYAEDRQLLDLAAQVHVRPSDFTRTRLIRRPMLAQRIYDAAEPLVAELAAYGVTPAKLADLRTKIDAARTGLGRHSLQIDDRQVATARIAVILAEINALLFNQIDCLLFPLRRTNPEFYATYRALRATRGRWRVLRQTATSLPVAAPHLGIAPIASPDSVDAPAATPNLANTTAVKLKIVVAPPAPLPLEPAAIAPTAAEARVA